MNVKDGDDSDSATSEHSLTAVEMNGQPSSISPNSLMRTEIPTDPPPPPMKEAVDSLSSPSPEQQKQEQAQLLQSMQLQIQQLSLENARLQEENSRLCLMQEGYTQQQQSLFQNRINEAKKKEAQKTLIAAQLEAQVQQLQTQVDTLQTQLTHSTQTKETLQLHMEALKQQCLETVQAAEHAWKEERALNEERKEKIKVYIETKAQELLSTQKQFEKVKLECNQSNDALSTVRKKLEDVSLLHNQDQGRIRELTKENQKLKKNTHQLSQLGDSLEYQLIQTTQESEEHQHKRNEARHELMTLLRKLEVEQVVVENFKEVITLSLTPKAKSQQQLLTTCIQDFQQALGELGRKLHRPPTLSLVGEKQRDDIVEVVEEEETHGSNKKKWIQSSKDISTIITNVEQETQQVSRGILEMIHLVEKMQLLLEDSSTQDHTCFTSITSLLHHAAHGGSSSSRSSSSSLSHGGGKRVVEHRRILPTMEEDEEES